MVDQPLCEICAYPHDEPSRKAAEVLGVGKTTVNRHRSKPCKPQLRDEFFDVPVEAITSRGASIRDPETGSWQKISYSPHKAAALSANRLAYDDLTEALEGYTTPAPAPAPTTPTTLVVNAADFQLGKVDEAGGSLQTIQNVLHCYEQVVAHVKRHNYQEIVFADLGDIVENFQNVTAQSQTNDLSLTDQIRGARRLMMEGLLRLAPLAPKISYVAVPSNHCAVRSGMGDKARANAPDDDYGLMIQDAIEDAFGLLPEHNVEFVRPAKWEESVTHTTVDGTTIGFTHGHLAKQPNNVGQWFKNQAAGKRSGLHNARVLVYGHFHHLRLQEVADGVMLVGTPTLDPGSAWLSNSTGDRSEPGMLTFDTKNGKLEGWHVYRP